MSKETTSGAAALPMRYDVRISSLHPDSGALKGTVSVNLNGQFAIRGVSVKTGKNGLFVSVPSYKNGNGEYMDLCFPCTKEARAAFDKAVLDAYTQALDYGTGGQAQATGIFPLQYDIRIHSLHPGGGTLRGTASANLNGQFAVQKIRIVEGSHGLFVSMPGFKGRNGEFKDHCFPCTKEAKAAFDRAVLNAYEQALTQNQAAGQGLSGGHQVEAPDPFISGTQSCAPEMRM